MGRNLFIFLVLFAFTLLGNYWLQQLHLAIGFTNFMIFCGIGIAALISIGFAWDAIERSRSQEVLPPAPRDPRFVGQSQHSLGDVIEHQSTPPNGGRARFLEPRES